MILNFVFCISLLPMLPPPLFTPTLACLFVYFSAPELFLRSLEEEEAMLKEDGDDDEEEEKEIL